MNSITVTRLDNGLYRVSPAEGLGAQCELDGQWLRTKWQKGVIQAKMSVKLGPISLAAVQALNVNESYTA